MKVVLWVGLLTVTMVLGEEKKKMSNLRLLALGDLPVAQPGLGLAGAPIVGPNKVPPSPVVLKNNQKNLGKIGLRLNVASKKVSVPGGVAEVSIFDGTKQVGEAWATVKLPTTGNYLAVIVRSSIWGGKVKAEVSRRATEPQSFLNIVERSVEGMYPCGMGKGLWAFLVMVSSVFGEGKGEDKSRLRFIALGPRPIYSYHPYRPTPPPVWKFPPKKITVKNAQGGFENIELRLGRISKESVVSGEAVEILSSDPDRGGEKEWARFKVPGKGIYLAVLLRSPEQRTPDWSKVEVVLLNEDEKSFPSGSMRIFNASSLELFVKDGEQKPSLVRPNAILMKKEAPAETLLKLAMKNNSGGATAIYSNHPPKLKEEERLSIFVYDEKESKRGNRAQFVVDSGPKGD